MQRRATYRLQLRQDFGFAEAAEQAEYLSTLGISHAYCSPYLQAASGSTHGYDVVDPTRVSYELGGPAGHRRFHEALREHGMSQLLDIVPNHMSVADRRNVWWWDVLADGQGSPYASYFDIDWEADEPRMRRRVLLPLLGDQVGRVLENGEISLVVEHGAILIAYFDHRFPLSIETVGELLAAGHVESAHPLLERAAALLAGTDDPSRAERFRERHELSAAMASLLAGEPAARAALDSVLAERNADIAELDRILSEQHHRLARWQTATEEVNYRRFFDINTLVAVRIEDPAVFAAVTALLGDLVAEGVADGLRVDHIDGLRQPLQYAERLRAVTSQECWLLAEKIVDRGERLPDWALDGTSGYDFLAVVNGLFVDPAGRSALEDVHGEITGNPPGFEEYARDGKREILRTTLVSDVERLTALLETVCEAYPAHRDHTHGELTDALVELIAAVPLYRTYVDPERGAASDSDAGLMRGAAAQAQLAAPGVDGRLLDFIADLFVFGEPEDVATDETQGTVSAQVELVYRLQQLCAATTAKGVEDTACYRHLVLVSLNEVGDSPARFGVCLDEFHEHNERTQRERPLTVLATSTHDTKRSEDVRTRIDVLTEVPEEWAAAANRWRAMNAVHRRDQWPDAAMEYLLYQTLVGAHPLDADRACAYMEKASREAKQHTGWLQPNDAYDGALAHFVRGILDDPRFTADLAGFAATLVPAGRINSLATTLLKLTSPGVPDVYQGTELWDLSLVDPDNRRPVDYAERRRLLDENQARTPAQAWEADPDSGAAKLALITTTLALRRRRPECFDERGAYVPVRAGGKFADDVVAFTRGAPASALSVAPRRCLRRRGLWENTMLTLPHGRWRNLCDGADLTGDVALVSLLASFPVALLELQR